MGSSRNARARGLRTWHRRKGEAGTAGTSEVGGCDKGWQGLVSNVAGLSTVRRETQDGVGVASYGPCGRRSAHSTNAAAAWGTCSGRPLVGVSGRLVCLDLFAGCGGL